MVPELRGCLLDVALQFDCLPGPCNAGELADLMPEPRLLIPAAVLIALVERNDGPRVLLTRRTARLRNHAGQVSFPGGRIEFDDVSPVAAALRETREEVGIHENLVRPQGYLESFDTITGFRVAPVVGWVDASYSPILDPHEVDELFEVPLEHFLDPATMQTRSALYRGRQRRYIAWEFQGHTIWGATAAMLLRLTQRLRGDKE